MTEMIRAAGNISYLSLFMTIIFLISCLIFIAVYYILVDSKSGGIAAVWLFLLISVATLYLMLTGSSERWIPSEGNAAQKILIRKYFKTVEGKPLSYSNSDVDWHIFVLNEKGLQYGMRVIRPDDKTLLYLRALETANREDIKRFKIM